MNKNGGHVGGQLKIRLVPAPKMHVSSMIARDVIHRPAANLGGSLISMSANTRGVSNRGSHVSNHGEKAGPMTEFFKVFVEEAQPFLTMPGARPSRVNLQGQGREKW